MMVPVDELLAAAKVLSGLVDCFIEIPEEQEATGRTALFLLLTQSYIQELAELLQEGMDPYDAIIAVSKGVMAA